MIHKPFQLLKKIFPKKSKLPNISDLQPRIVSWKITQLFLQTGGNRVLQCTTRLKVYVTALGAYDLIIGMDWLAAHRALVDCFAKRMICVDDEGRPVEIQGVQRKVSLRFISTMKVK